MRLAFLGWADHVHVQRWAGYFAKSGHRVHLLNLGSEAETVRGATSADLWARQRGSRWVGSEIRARLLLFRPDVLHAHWGYFGYFAYLSRVRPYGVTVWGSDIYHLGELSSQNREETRCGLKNAAFVTCDSEHLREHVVQMGVPHSRVHIVQWGVDTDLFRPDRETCDLRSKLGIREQQTVVFSPRQLDPVYRIEVVLRAFQALAQVRPDCVLLQKYYKSTPEDVARLRAEARKLGIETKVRWIGRLHYHEIADLYALSDIVVSVAATDGTPISVLEAMATGLPVVVTQLPSVLEWVADGSNGLTVPVGDAGALTEALLALVDDHARRMFMGRTNRALVVERASQQAHMERMLSVYAQVAGRNSALTGNGG